MHSAAASYISNNKRVCPQNSPVTQGTLYFKGLEQFRKGSAPQNGSVAHGILLCYSQALVNMLKVQVYPGCRRGCSMSLWRIHVPSTQPSRTLHRTFVDPEGTLGSVEGTCTTYSPGQCLYPHPLGGGEIPLVLKITPNRIQKNVLKAKGLLWRLCSEGDCRSEKPLIRKRTQGVRNGTPSKCCSPPGLFFLGVSLQCESCGRYVLDHWCFSKGHLPPGMLLFCGNSEYFGEVALRGGGVESGRMGLGHWIASLSEVQCARSLSGHGEGFLTGFWYILGGFGVAGWVGSGRVRAQGKGQREVMDGMLTPPR